ncbi:MAG: hybrid sensor histidine kinase/response regulator [Gemmatimonadetes bacterium]|nr:MAG: hybrid sensor histidine kinase/response regulator [Gemmatimonadota bacterium]
MPRKKILLIEDEATIRENVATMLEVSGYEAIEADNGLDGWKRIQEDPPDLIICDIMMPGMSGYDVLSAVQADPVLAQIPFIFLTAKTDRNHWRRGIEMGADDYLMKPFSGKELIAAIEARFTKVDTFRSKKDGDLVWNLIHALPHEFRTPLTSILGFTQLLLEEYKTVDREDLHRMLETIYESADRLDRLVKNYLLYAQIEIALMDHEKMELVKKNITTGVASVVSYVAMNVAKAYGREEDLVLDVEPCTVQVSEKDLPKLVEEVISNAFKFSEAGTTVEVKSRNTETHFILDVTDHGRGMSRHQIDRIGAYVQFDRKLYEQKGLGLGLIIARRLTEIHGGHLSVQSEMGKYTTVTIQLERREIS